MSKEEAQEEQPTQQPTSEVRDRLDYNNSEQVQLLNQDIFNSPFNPLSFDEDLSPDGDDFNFFTPSFNNSNGFDGQYVGPYESFNPSPQLPPPTVTQDLSTTNSYTNQPADPNEDADQFQGRNYLTNDSLITSIKSINQIKVPLVKTGSKKQKEKPKTLNDVIKESLTSGINTFIENTSKAKALDPRSAFVGLNVSTLFLPYFKYEFQPDSRTLRDQADSKKFYIPNELCNELKALKEKLEGTAGVNTQIKGLVAKRKENEQINAEIEEFLKYQLPDVQNYTPLIKPKAIIDWMKSFKQSGKDRGLTNDVTYKEHLKTLKQLEQETLSFFPPNYRRLGPTGACCYGTTCPSGEDMLNLLKLEGLGVYGTREEELIKIGCVYGYNCALAYLETIKKFKRAYNKANGVLEKLKSSRSSEEPPKPPKRHKPQLMESEEDFTETTKGLRGKRILKKVKRTLEEDSDSTEENNTNTKLVKSIKNNPKVQASLHRFMNSNKSQKKQEES